MPSPPPPPDRPGGGDRGPGSASTGTVCAPSMCARLNPLVIFSPTKASSEREPRNHANDRQGEDLRFSTFNYIFFSPKKSIEWFFSFLRGHRHPPVPSLIRYIPACRPSYPPPHLPSVSGTGVPHNAVSATLIPSGAWAPHQPDKSGARAAATRPASPPLLTPGAMPKRSRRPLPPPERWLSPIHSMAA